MTHDPNEWLTIREAAETLKVTPMTVRRMIAHGELSVIGKDRTRLVNRASINVVSPRKVGRPKKIVR